MFPSSATPSKWLTFRVESDSTGRSVGQTQRISVIRGVATFRSPKIGKAGAYDIIITDPTGNTMTELITVMPSAPAKLAFVSTPASLESSSTVAVDVQDRYGNVTTAADGIAVTLQLAPHSALGRHPLLIGTVTATVIDGVATFPDVSVDRNGTGLLIASSGKLGRARSGVFRNI